MLLAFACGCLTGCGDSNPTKPPSTVAKHEHKPPHGGTPVVLGDEEYHVELVLDAPAGKLDAYVFDGELENFVRSTAPEFQVLAKLPSGGQTLVFKPIPNSATGETVGDTSLFETQADWLKKETNFDAVLKQITVRGKSYENVEFNFPKGNDKDEKPK
ncbi:MAG TPA: hypothetical protein VG754_01945 [Verrucomicrobiae bacterium]|nr:hypothetical protein [Verrucomicrobiae bacterium]